MAASRTGKRKKRSAVRTPDGRYIVVRGRLWRAADPSLSEAARKRLVRQLMRARRAVRAAAAGTRKKARAAVHKAKVGLGERGPAWWTDGAPDLNRRLVRNTPYAGWWKRKRSTRKRRSS